MPKIRQLINFEKIKEVIDIDAITDKKGMVEKYVISPSLEGELVVLLKDLNNSNHKAAQVIGGYGSGKSHLLAFLISILTEKDLRNSIQDENVREEAQKLSRDFLVVHWELQPNDVELSEYLYDNLQTQLEERYGVSLNLPTTGVKDHKKAILNILDAVKKEDPTRGLVVVVDEISDFLKQKTKEKINRDVQFLRVLGQVAQTSDFMFVGAMQEHIFTNPKYVDEAESFGRVSERFQIIPIKREDIKRVISKRVLNKTPEQRIELENLFKEYTKYFPSITPHIDEYIDLFPLHPYVIQIFSELPYFEKRGVIQFTIQEVERILDKDFPHIITYDLIFDEIASKHTVKNLEQVSPVVDAVETLDSKIDLLDSRHQGTAKNLIKALAILRLYGKSTSYGATVEELANTLLVLPANKMVTATDEIALVLSNLRKVTDGQFVNNKEGYYFLDLSLDIDYDQVIARKAENLPENAMEDEILLILKDQLLLAETAEPGVFKDSCRWQSRKSFREGIFIYENGKGPVRKLSGDYQIIFKSPFCTQNRYKPTANALVMSCNIDQNAVEALKKTAAAKALVNENYSKNIMEKKYIGLRKPFVEAFVKCYLDTGYVESNGEKKSIKSLISREFTNFDELLSEIKPSRLDEYFNTRYPKHPKFSQAITADNIKGEFSSAVKEVIAKGGKLDSLFSSAKSILNALSLADDSGNMSTAKSEVAKQILAIAKKEQGKNVDVGSIIDSFSEPDFGYHRLMTAFVLVMLTFNGEIVLRAAGGKVVTSSEVEEVFGGGIDAFENIKYLAVEGDFDIQPVIDLFTILGINPAKLRVSSSRGEAVQEFRTKYLELKEQVDFIQKKLTYLSLHEAETIDIDNLGKKQKELDDIPFSDFDKVKTPNDLKKIVYEALAIKKIGEALKILQQLHMFCAIYFEKISKDVEYVKEIRKVLESHPLIFQVEEILQLIAEAFEILRDAEKLLLLDELNPLIGKLQLIRKKYVAAYYTAHEKYVGGKVNWTKLSDLLKTKTYENLKKLKLVDLLSKNAFMNIESSIAILSNLHCPNFKVELLENKPVCPQCFFPQGFSMQDMNTKIQQIEIAMQNVFDAWEATILTEVNNYRGNLQYLDAREQKLIEGVIKAGKLPASVTDELVNALNNLFKELESIEINPRDFFEEVFRDTQVMDYFSFERKINEIKQKLVAGKDLDKIRIKFAAKGDE